MALTLKAVNLALAKLGVRLERGNGFFFFFGGEAADWLVRGTAVPRVNSLTVEQWIGEFERLRKVNAQIIKSRPSRSVGQKPGGGS